MDNQISSNNDPGNGSMTGYGRKGGWKKWLLIYAVIAIIVYGVIYYFFMRDTGSTGGTLGY